MEAVKIVTICLVVFVAIVPISVVLYQFDGYYTQKVYPLNEAGSWLTGADTFVPYSPNGVLQDINNAWSYMNQSEKNANVGNGSPCWIWAVPTQTYGYSESFFVQIESSVYYYTHHGYFFNNSTMASWGNIQNAINNIQNSLTGGLGPTVAGCLFFGNFISIVLMFVVILGIFVATPILTITLGD